MYCQRCGRKNKPDAETCRFCKAPLLAVRQDRTPEGGDLQSFLGIEEYVIDKISSVEKQAHRSSEDVDLLVQAVDFLEKNAMVTRAGIHVLVRMLKERGLLGASEFHGRWRRQTLDNLLGLHRKDRFLELKPHILAAFSGKNRRRFEERILRAEDHMLNLEWEAALAGLKEAAELSPENGPLLGFLGETCLRTGDLEAAGRYLGRAEERRVRDPEVVKARASLLLLEGKAKEARVLLVGLSRKHPREAHTLSLLALAEALAGDFGAAARRAEEVLELEENPGALYILAHGYLRASRLSRAEEHLQRILSAYPECLPALRLLAGTYLARGWWRRAEEVLERWRALDAAVEVGLSPEHFQGLPPAERWKRAIPPLSAREVLDLLDPVTEEADVFLRQVNL